MLEVVILAAGKGTRMKSGLPKVLHPIGGKPMLAHVIDAARALRPTAIHVVAGHGTELIDAFCEASEDLNVVIQAQQLGTGHAVAQALPYLDLSSRCLILYGDVPLINAETLKALVAPVESGTMGLLTVELEDPTGYGRILRDDRGSVVKIVEQKDASEQQLAIREGNTGVMAISTDDLSRWLPKLSSDNAQNEYYLTDVVEMATEEGSRIVSQTATSEDEVAGVNDRVQQALLERAYQTRIADSLLRQGVTLMDPSRFDCRGELIPGSDVIIDVNCIIEGRVILGDNVSVGANCILKDCSIDAGTVIKPFSMIDGSSIAKDCDIGPYARIRPGTDLQHGAKLGNFVETKKSTIGPGSKVNHLSYIGDATIGQHVNVGAGTITCNYDGVNKWKTTIGDGAFIGSNTSLVAPVEVGAEATVGAGSTITAAVPDHALGVARGKQRNIDSWKRPQKSDS